MRTPLIAGAAGLATFTLLRVRDPHVDGAYGFCPFLLLTGQPCPGCGGLRAVNLLTRGEVVAAVSSNLFAVGLVLIAVVSWAVWLGRRARGIPTRYLTWSARTVTVLGVIAAVFGLARLTPWGAWLAP